MYRYRKDTTMYSDGKPYYSLNSYYREKFGKKIAKLSLDAGFSCPNRDGTISTGGCTFCSIKGSGDFASERQHSITEQLQSAKELVSNKWQNAEYIAYFQAFTNTYAPVEVLKQKYYEALSFPNIVGISIATRPDCLDEDVLSLLSQLNQETALWLELGLQSSNEKTAKRICRGYPNKTFEKAVYELHNRKIEVITHVILGLPEETIDDMINTIYYLNKLPIQGIKLQLLHVLEYTSLAEEYKKGVFETLNQEEYIEILCQCIGHLRPDIVIHRLTGDGNPETLLAPLWSLRKRTVLNTLHKELKQRGITQGCYL